jgi:hypothetical protein
MSPGRSAGMDALRCAAPQGAQTARGEYSAICRGADGKPIWIPDRLPRLDVAQALAAVELPLHLNWSTPGRIFNLRSRADRARVYEMVLQEGTPADVLVYVDGALLVDLWEDLVLPATSCSPYSTGLPRGIPPMCTSSRTGLARASCSHEPPGLTRASAPTCLAG